MTLPTKTSKGGAVSLGELVWFIYGPPGIGKSTLASGFHNGKKKPLFLWTSPIKYIGGVYKKRISNWEDFENVVKELQHLKGKRYSVIVIDVIDFLWLHCRQDVLEQRGVEHETDLSHGKGYDMVKRVFIPEIAKLCTCGYGVIFISHAASRETQPTRGIKEQKIVPTLQDSAKGIILPICAIEGYLGFSADDIEENDEKRKIFFEPTGLVEAKDWTGQLPKVMNLNKDPLVTAHKLTKHLLAEVPKKNTKKKKRKKRS